MPYNGKIRCALLAYLELNMYFCIVNNIINGIIWNIQNYWRSKLLEDFELIIHGGLRVKYQISIKTCNRDYIWIVSTP